MEVRSNLLEKLVGEVKKTSTGVQRGICNEYRLFYSAWSPLQGASLAIAVEGDYIRNTCGSRKFHSMTEMCET